MQISTIFDCIYVHVNVNMQISTIFVGIHGLLLVPGIYLRIISAQMLVK